MSGLPEAVRKQQEEADKKIEAIQNGRQSPSATTPPAQPPENQPPEAPAAETQVQQVEQPKQHQAKTHGELPAADDVRALQARYNTLSGKYNAEVPRLQSELREARDMNQRLLAQLEALRINQQVVQKPTQSDAPNVQPRQLAKPEEVDTYGDVLKVTERIATQAAQDASTQVRGQMQQELANIRRSTMFAELDQLYPAWRSVNEDALFKAWCGEVDLLSGLMRQQLLENALDSFSSQRVATFFKQFEESMKSSQAGAAIAAHQAPPSLESQVTPKKRGPDSSAPAAQKRVFKASEIKTISEDVARGMYKTRPQELQRIMNEIDLAMAEGRVQLSA